jgi:hypothetical protein
LRIAADVSDDTRCARASLEGWKKNPCDTSGGLRGSKSVNLILNFRVRLKEANNFEIGFDRSAFAVRRRPTYRGGSALIRIET